MLGNEGLHRIAGVRDSREVQARLPIIQPDLVLLDLHMPHLDGKAVLRQVLHYAAGTYLPVLVLTADASRHARETALANGARDFLTKPIDLTETTLRVANLLETRQLYNTLRPNPASAEVTSTGEMRERIDSVLDQASLHPVFQRIADLADLTTVGYEALARFDEPHERGPAGWFADAFTVGRGVELEWLAAQAALASLPSMPAECFLAVNMSPATILHVQEAQLCDPDLCPRVVVELTEHVPIEDYAVVHAAFDEVRRHGARLAADDLGAGYAGFRHLIALEPDIIKLDISLVSSIIPNRGARALARALVAFATDVGATIVAEGVETADELQALVDLGVPWAQGYHLGRPGSVFS